MLDPLNKEQREAVTTTEGPVLVLAGPGSGKTRVLTHRIAHMVKDCGIPPTKTMAVTFTNKAANEMKERLERLMGNQLRGLTVGTFHAICARILRREADHTPFQSNFTIY
ncbi:MAG: UvrD-helicase domain-containing protein, partial [Anaerolineae bacterium]|nr:UvrD-helicase domain-containing protein [Anaerolineae bacterium]